jgi:hypothetical protein
MARRSLCEFPFGQRRRRSPSLFTLRRRGPLLGPGREEVGKGAAGPNHHRRPLRHAWFDAPCHGLVSGRLRGHLIVWGADGPDASGNRGEGTVLCRRIQRRHRPAAVAPGRALVVWPRGRPSRLRRSTALVWTVRVARTSSRPPASVSRDAPCRASVTNPGLISRRVTVSERLTCGRRCIRFTFPIRCGECMSNHLATALALAPSQ